MGPFRGRAGGKLESPLPAPAAWPPLKSLPGIDIAKQATILFNCPFFRISYYSAMFKYSKRYPISNVYFSLFRGIIANSHSNSFMN